MNTTTLARALSFASTWIESEQDRHDIPGLVVAVARHGDIVMNEAWGWANVEESEQMETSHVFRVASHSKTFTATAIMLLQEDGKLRLDDFVHQHLPWLAEHRDPRWRSVTLRQLLSHGAGVIRDGADADYWRLKRPFPDRERLKAEILAQDLVVDNNTRHKYSNYGYSLLGSVIEAVTGQTYGAFVSERIIAPLGLASTHPDYDPTWAGGQSPRLATGYSRRVRRERRPYAHANTAAMAAATGFCATAEDLCRYFTAHMLGSGLLLSDESKKEMQRAQWRAKTPGDLTVTEYGIGFVLTEVAGTHLFGHSGGFPGFVTLSAADPSRGLVVVALSNADGPVTEIVHGIYQVIKHFEDAEDKAERDLSPFEGVFANEGEDVALVALGGHVAAANLASPDPLGQPEKLEYVDDSTLRVVEASSFSSEGELVHFEREAGKFVRIRYTGTTLWPKDA